MTKSELIKPVQLVQAAEVHDHPRDAGNTVSVVDGEPVALNGVAPVLTMRIADPDEDLPQLVRAAEALLPFNRELPGVVALDAEGAIVGAILRADLEEAVLLRRRGDYVALTESLGLDRAYHEPGGDPEAPFIYWKCPVCSSLQLPRPGHENDAPTVCRRHTPHQQMARRVHAGY